MTDCSTCEIREVCNVITMEYGDEIDLSCDDIKNIANGNIDEIKDGEQE